MKQISVFTENKMGVLEYITGIFTDNQINVDAMMVNDSAEFGTARFIIDKPELAAKKLAEAGYIVKTASVVGVFLKDNYGELHKILNLISSANINLDYVYATFDRNSASPIVILKNDDDSDIIESILVRAGYTVK